MIYKMNTDAMHIKRFDYTILTKIYNNGTKQISKNNTSITQSEIALCMSAGHAIDLVEASQGRGVNTLLDFSLETQKNIGAAVINIFLKELEAKIPEAKIRNSVAKKVSAYLLFEMWNYFQISVDQVYDIEFDLALGIDFATGNKSIVKQGIILKNKNDANLLYHIDILNVGKKFTEKGIDVINNNIKPMVGVNMNYLFNLIKTELDKFVS